MNKLVKKAIFLVSVHKNEGLTEEQLMKLLHQEFDETISFKDEDLLKVIRATPEIALKEVEAPITKAEARSGFKAHQKSEKKLVANKDSQMYALKDELLNLHFHNADSQDDSDTIFQMYQEIVKSGADGITYEELSNIFAKKSIKNLTKEKLESYMVSNYCRKLAKHNFINISFQNLRRIAQDIRFTKVAVEDFINVNKKTNAAAVAENTNSQATFNLEDADDLQGQPKKFMAATQENILDYLNKETFTIRELTQRQNIVLNLQSYFAQTNDGLTTKEICLKIRMLHEKKALDRIIKSIEKLYQVETIAARMGKSYSHKYLIKQLAIKNFRLPAEESQTLSKFQDRDILKTIKAENEDLESRSELQNVLSNFGSVKRGNVSPVIQFEVFQDILNAVSENLLFEAFLATKGEKLSELKNLKPTDEDYVKTSEKVLQILVDNEPKLSGGNADFKEPEPAETKTGGFSKKSLTRLKLNRYIFILNKVKENEIITNIALKNMIINEIEVGAGWKIDRRTLRSLLIVLQKLKLINLQDHKFNYSYPNINLKTSQQQQQQDANDLQYTRTVVLDRKIEPTDARINDILEKSNMANLKKEAEEVKVYLTRSRRTPQDKQAITLDKESQEIEGMALRSKKIKTKIEDFESIQKNKENFEEMVGDEFAKLKKFDFASCKLYAKDYQVMMFSSYFERLFTQKERIAKQFGMRVLKHNRDHTIYEDIQKSNKTLASSLSSLLRWQRDPFSVSHQPLNLFKQISSSTLRNGNTILSYGIDSRDVCESIGKSFENSFRMNLEADFEVHSILKGSSNYSNNYSMPSQLLGSPPRILTSTEYSTASSTNGEFLNDVEKRLKENSIFLNDEERTKKQKEQELLGRSITINPVKNIDQLFSKFSKIPERKAIFEHMALSDDLIVKEVTPLSQPDTMEIEPIFRSILRVVPDRDVDKALDSKNAYSFIEN